MLNGSPMRRRHIRDTAAFSVEFLFNLQVHVIEIGIIQISSVTTSHSRWQRLHSDFLPLRDDSAKSLQFNKSVAELNRSILKRRRKAMNAEIGGDWFVTWIARCNSTQP